MSIQVELLVKDMQHAHASTSEVLHTHAMISLCERGLIR